MQSIEDARMKDFQGPISLKSNYLTEEERQQMEDKQAKKMAERTQAVREKYFGDWQPPTPEEITEREEREREERRETKEA